MPIGEVIAFSPVEGRDCATVLGVVTLTLGEGLVIQDDTAGIWIEVTQARRMHLLQTDIHKVLELREGDLIEVAGKPERGGYAPTIVPMTITKNGTRSLPPARPYDRNRFFLGLDDCLRVEAAGVVRGFREDVDNGRWVFLVADVTRDFWVDVAKEVVRLPPVRYVDASIRCTGVATARSTVVANCCHPD